jgi:hypothetical protein
VYFFYVIEAFLLFKKISARNVPLLRLLKWVNFHFFQLSGGYLLVQVTIFVSYRDIFCRFLAQSPGNKKTSGWVWEMNYETCGFLT